MPEIQAVPVSKDRKKQHLLALVDHEIFLTQRRIDAAQEKDFKLAAHIIRDQALLLCDLAKAVEEYYGVGGGN